MTGNAHPALAQAIADEIGTTLVHANVGSFPDEESQVEIYDNVREHDVFLVQPTGPPANQNIMEALIVIDTLKRASAGRITAVIPYFGYARQDRKERSRVPITAKLVTNLYAAAGVDRFVAVNLHADQIQGFTDVPFDHLYATKTITEAIGKEIDNPVVVAPDIGAGAMARHWAGRMNTEWAQVDKDRLDERTTRIAAFSGHSVAGRNALIVDDIASTAGSLLKAADTLMERGALSVTAAVSHGVLRGGALERIQDSESLSRLYVTDTLPPPPGGYGDKITPISIAPLLAQAISHIHEGKSVSDLF
jgi:ribose-phosphate pyrophosphokinase